MITSTTLEAFLVEFEVLCKKYGISIVMDDPYDAVEAVPYTENGNNDFVDNLRGSTLVEGDPT